MPKSRVSKKIKENNRLQKRFDAKAEQCTKLEIFVELIEEALDGLGLRAEYRGLPTPHVVILKSGIGTAEEKLAAAI